MNAKNRKSLRLLLVYALCALLLVAPIFILPIRQIAVFQGAWVRVLIWITNTGGTWGIGLLLLVCSFLLGWEGVLKVKLLNVCRLFFLLSFFVGSTALVNEILIKEQLKIHRPSIRFLEKEIGLNADGFYQQENKQLRREYLKKYLLDRKSQKIKVKGECLNDDVLQVWIKEAGYSFPSGHTVSAFLVTILLGYLIIVRKGSLYKYWLVVLFMWAVVIAYSRVVLGVHTPVDVFGGAVWGSVISFGLILSGSLKSVFVNKEPLKK